MKITQEVRDFAAEKGMETYAAMEEGMKEKAAAFAAQGGEIYL
jgi:phosphomethylpyrimidine synthase